MSITRSRAEKLPEHPVLGKLLPTLDPQYLSPLPTNGDALRHYFFLKQGEKRNEKPSDVMKLVVKKIEKFWNKAGIPVSETKNGKGKRMLESLIKDLLTCRKYTPKKKENIAKFLKKIDLLFDIAHQDAEEKIQKDTLRSAKKKTEDLNFIIDQRGPRLLGLGKVDKDFETRVENRNRRLAAEEKRKVKSLEQTTAAVCANSYCY